MTVTPLRNEQLPAAARLADAVAALGEPTACRSDGCSWFIDGNSPADRADREYVEALCAACPVQAACLEAALERDERYGVWGGVDFQWERYRLRRTTTTPDKRPA